MQEVLVKYLAGLIDSDGTISFNFNAPNADRTAFKLYMNIAICSSEAVDFHRFIATLPDQTGFGRVDTTQGHNKSSHAMNRWTVMKRPELEMLIPRIVKHAFVKGGHLQRLFEIWREKRGQSLSVEECEALKEFSKASRLESGPLKSKNFPSYAWLAGYLDGNGSFRVGRKRNGSYKGEPRYSNQASVHASCHKGDGAVLEFIHKAHGGYVKQHSSNANCMVWERNLGPKDRSFALDFLPRLVQHSRLKKHKIEQLIASHRNRPQRLSEQTLEGEATV
jgi:hypothetical protein